jgi:hypothetical protein
MMETNLAVVQTPKPSGNWTKRITQSEKFLANCHSHGQSVYDRYEDNREHSLQNIKKVNLFHANVKTALESAFNSLPKPDVSRIHKGDYEDDASRVAALIMQRVLHYEVQCDHGFTEAVKGAILERLVPGIGQSWVGFNQDQSLRIERVFWEDFLYEPARCWRKVGWVGRKLALTKKDVIKRFGEDAVSKLEMVKHDSSPKEIDQDKYCVYEIWDKRTKTVIHTAKGLDKPLKETEDPYNLPDFYPCPEPLMANATTKAFLPITDYHIAQDQYIQLDTLYARMALIIEAVKVAGAYDSSESSIGKMLEGQENKLVPVDNWAMFAEKGGSRGMIDWYPVETVVSVLQSLEGSFQSIKALLHEVTGMSDIFRGDTNQYETAEAQQLKAGFASVRMNGGQRSVADFVTDVLNIMGSMICNLYAPDHIIKLAGGFSPADQQHFPQAMQILKNNLLRSYKITIQADSLTQADWSAEKSQRMELMGYVSQYLASAVQTAQQFPELGPLLVSMLKFGMAGYKGSSEVEGIVDQALQQMVNNPEPKKDEPSPEQQKMQMEQQKAQMQFQIEQQKAQMEAQLKQQESNNRMQLEQMQAKADMAVEQQKMEHSRELHAMDIRLKQLEMAIEREKAELTVGTQAAKATIELDKKQRED